VLAEEPDTMSKIVLAAAALALSMPAQAVTLVQWDFEGATTPPDLANSSTSPTVAASLGTGTAWGVHADAATDWTTPVGNGSANALSSNSWAQFDYYEFNFSSLGFLDLKLSVDHTGSSTGPRDFSVLVGFGPAYFFVAAYSLVGTPPWNSSTPSSVHTYTFDLSAIDTIEDQGSVSIRLASSNDTAIGGGSVAAGGTSRLDNFTIMATPVPEAGTAALLAAGLAVIGVAVRRRT
jgi:hypothetical protein